MPGWASPRSQGDLGVADEDHEVMDHGAVAGARLRHAHPFVFGETGGQHHVLVVDIGLGGDGERLRHLENEVGLGNVPAFEELARRGRVLGFAGFGAFIGPGGERVDLFLGE